MCHDNDFGKDVEDIALVAGAAYGGEALLGADAGAAAGAAGDIGAGTTADAAAGLAGEATVDTGIGATGATTAAGTLAGTDGFAGSAASTDFASSAEAAGSLGGVGDLGASSAVVPNDILGTAFDQGVAPSAISPEISSTTDTSFAPGGDISGATDSTTPTDVTDTSQSGATNGVLNSAGQNGMGFPSDGSTIQSAANGASGNASVQSALQQLGAIGKSASTYAPLAGLGLNAYAQHKAQSAADQLKSVAAPASAASNKLLSQYQTGTLNPADANAIAQYEQQQNASIKQYYANAGLSNSSMEAEALSQVAVQANTMRSQAVENLLTGGLQAAGVAQGPQVAAVQASVSADNQLSQATSNFMNALAKMNTQQGTGNTPTPTPTPTP